MPALKEIDRWGLTPVDHMLYRIAFRKSRYEGHLTPLSLDKPMLIAPGSSGGVNWGGISLDPDYDVMIVNSMRLIDRIRLVTRQEAKKGSFAWLAGKAPRSTLAVRCCIRRIVPMAHSSSPPLGVPCNQPLWGMISAVNLHTGKLIWSKPQGTGRDTGPLGIPTRQPVIIGVPMTGGSVTMRGGLVFIGAVAERTFRAVDVHSGEELWSGRLPAGGNSCPVTYIGPRRGRQFVLIAAGGRKSLEVRQGTKIIAYVLPESRKQSGRTSNKE